MNLGKTLTIRSSPHLASGRSVDRIMFQVVLALVPVCGFAIFEFGLAALLTLSTAVFSCVSTEFLLASTFKRPVTINDGSAIVTGLLFGLTLPPSLPLWMVFAGGVLAIGVGKMLFGGLGYNSFNPALVGRALLQAAFPVAMTTWAPMPSSRFVAVPTSNLAWPFTQPQYDALTGATPLSEWKFEHVTTATSDLFLGTISGSTGETSALLILLGGVFLIARGIMSWHIPVGILATVASLSLIMRWLDPNRYADPAFMLFSGGLMLGAIFMATDPVGSPMTRWGMVIYGILIGLLILTIRYWGGMPEGVMYAILIGNAVSPHIDRWIQPRAFGTKIRRLRHE